ncbi:MAG: RHS repeat-associated core domain-containing protein [Xanthobacteraceae bacterium]
MTDAVNREVIEYDGTSGAIGNWYSFAPAVAFGVDAVLNQISIVNSTRGTLIPDILGSLIRSLDASSGNLAKTGYQTYGENPTLTSGSYQYTARRFDPETAGSASQPSGLYYYRARMYAPAWARFLQTDPVGYTAGSNLYAYTNNDPLNLVNPYGAATLQIGLAGSVGIPFTPIHIPLGFGVAFDTQGHVGIYGYGGLGGQVGADVEAGVSVQVSNALTISDLTSPFGNVSGHEGLGLGGSMDYFAGSSADGPVAGGGATLGAAAGASVSAGVTNTWLYAPFGSGATPSNPSTPTLEPASMQPSATSIVPVFTSPGSLTDSSPSGLGTSSSLPRK